MILSASLAALVLTVAPAAPQAQVVTTFQDERIDESSGAVVRGDHLFTVNDSGDGPYLYEVDLGTGRTVGVTTFASDDPEDVEALAAGPGDVVWVGDVGDNRRSRASVTLYRFVPARGTGTASGVQRFELVYPDGPHDAETLLVHPGSGRVYVVTKSLRGGGVVFRAPRRLDPSGQNRLEEVASVPGLVTDGTFLPGGRRVLLRTYAAATVYSYPGFERLLGFPLPQQEQGEAVAVDPDGRIYLTSEGEGSAVLALDLPHPSAAPREATGSPGDRLAPPEDHSRPSSRYDPQPWMGLGPAGLLAAALGSAGVLALGWWLLRACRRRSRRRR